MKQTGRSKGIASVAVAIKLQGEEANDTLDRGVIMRAYDGKGKVDKSIEEEAHCSCRYAKGLQTCPKYGPNRLSSTVFNWQNGVVHRGYRCYAHFVYVEWIS